jgi:hypothetical protein
MSGPHLKKFELTRNLKAMSCADIYELQLEDNIREKLTKRLTGSLRFIAMRTSD